MNGKTLLGAGLAIASAHAAAQDRAVVLYGRLNVALESVSNSADVDRQSTRVTRESSYRSVFGLRGSEALGDGLKAIFQIESTLSLDTGVGGIAARDTRLGLEGRLGTVFAGNWTTPYNSATSALDPYYPTTAGYMSIMGNGAASTVDNVSNTSSFDRRQQNSVHFWSPVWKGFSLRVAQGLNEEAPKSGARPSLTSAALIYDHGPVYAVLAHERHHEYQGPRSNDNGSKIALAYQWGPTRIAGVVEKLTYETPTGTLERKSYFLTATHERGRHVLHFNVARAGDGEGASVTKVGFIKRGPDTGATHYSIGYDYNLSKRTSVFAFYTHLHNQENAVYDFGNNGVGVSPGATLKATSFGMRHAF